MMMLTDRVVVDVNGVKGRFIDLEGTCLDGLLS
jgi:hypothetical protein